MDWRVCFVYLLGSGCVGVASLELHIQREIIRCFRSILCMRSLSIAIYAG